VTAPTHAALIGQPVIVDGDTIKLSGTHIRLQGIDAPESDQTCQIHGTAYIYSCGQRATAALKQFIGAAVVRRDQTGTDRWQRVVAKCFVSEKDIGEWMVREGWAEDDARSRQRGIWAGTFIMPDGRGHHSNWPGICRSQE